MKNDNMIKLHIPGESFWAERLTENTARVENILLDFSIGLNDIVLFNQENEVLEVIQKNSKSAMLKYANEPDTVRENYAKIYEYFKGHRIGCEGMFAGEALLSLPIELSDIEFEIIASKCPVEIEIVES